MYSLKDLPDRDFYYGFSLFPNPPSGERCISCERLFDTLSDPSDHFEHPCRCVQIELCDHLIGSECLTQIIEHGTATCPHCNQEFTSYLVSVPSWITFLLGSDSDCLSLAPGSMVRLAPEIIKWNPEWLMDWNESHQQLFHGKLDGIGGRKLWAAYQLAGVTYLLRIVFSSALLFSVLGTFLKQQTPNAVVRLLLYIIDTDGGANTLFGILMGLVVVPAFLSRLQPVFPRPVQVALADFSTLLNVYYLIHSLSPWLIMCFFTSIYLVFATMTGALIKIGVEYQGQP